MGFLEEFFGYRANPSGFSIQKASAKSIQPAQSYSEEPAQLSKQRERLLRGSQVDVVGESYYSASFKKLSKFQESSAGHSKLRTAELHVDPSNPYSKSGKAVAVRIQGHQVGHLPERIAPLFFDFISDLGGSVECEAQVSFDSAEYGYKWSSVRLFTLCPPVLEKEAGDYKVPSIPYGDSEHRLGTFAPVEIEGTVIASLEEGDSHFGYFNVKQESNGMKICSVDQSPLLTSDGIEAGLRLPFGEQAILYYLALVITRNSNNYEVKFFSQSEIKTKKVRSGNSVSAAGNALSQKATIFLLPTDGGWVKFKSAKQFSSLLPGLAEAEQNGSGLYLWAEVQWDGRLFSPNFGGLLGEVYANKQSWLRSEFKRLSFYVLTRVHVQGGKLQVEVNIDKSSQFLPFPLRPAEPAQNRQLSTTKPIIQKQSKAQSPKTAVLVTPFFSMDFDLSLLDEGSITGSGFTYLEDLIWDVFVELGWRGEHRVTKSRTSVFVAGSNLDINTSAAARDAAKDATPIVPMQSFRREARERLLESRTYRALERYEAWILHMQGDVLSAGKSPVKKLLNTDFDAILVPGGAVDNRSPGEDLSFIGDLKGTLESKEMLREFFRSLGGVELDSIIVLADATYIGADAKLRLEYYRGPVFLGRTPANQSESLADWAQLVGVTKSWVRIDWKSANRFVSSFDCYAVR